MKSFFAGERKPGFTVLVPDDVCLSVVRKASCGSGKPETISPFLSGRLGRPTTKNVRECGHEIIMTFNELNMAEPILKAVREKGYDELTPIQQRAIPIALRGADILGIAQTGTGKTAAFALPLLQRLIEERSLEREPSAVAGETVPLRRERREGRTGKAAAVLFGPSF